MTRRQPLRRERGATLIEVLVTMVIIAFGLLGMAGLQVRMQVSELESYQRSQALLLLNDMANRLAANRNSAASYITTGSLGTGAACPTATSADPLVQQDRAQWCDALQGAGVIKSGANLGAMVGGRGCVTQLSSSEYMVTVAWQGMAPISAPPASVTCGANQYDGAQCSSDKCRRVVTTLVRIAGL